MKLLRKLLGIILVIGIVGGIWGIWGLWGRWGIDKIKDQSFDLAQDKGSKFKVEETRNEEENQSIKFAVMSDIHSDWENFREALQKVRDIWGIGDINSFVIVTGDLTTLGKKSELIEAKKILDESGLRYYAIPGNHDIWWGREYKKDVWKEVFGESFQSFKDGKVKFILVNNGDGKGGFEGFGGVGQKEWLNKEVEECLKIYCLVFMHMPLNHPSSLHVMGEDNPPVASEAARIRELLVRNNAKEIFAGHLHFSSNYKFDGLKTTIVGSLATERNFQSPKFLEVEAKKTGISSKDIFISD